MRHDHVDYQPDAVDIPRHINYVYFSFDDGPWPAAYHFMVEIFVDVSRAPQFYDGEVM